MLAQIGHVSLDSYRYWGEGRQRNQSTEGTLTLTQAIHLSHAGPKPTLQSEGVWSRFIHRETAKDPYGGRALVRGAALARLGSSVWPAGEVLNRSCGSRGEVVMALTLPLILTLTLDR